MERFISPCELEHLDRLITARRAAFKQSPTDDTAGKDLLSWERTSLTLMLPKSVNAAIRAIEARATDLVGLPPDHIEPLQVVSYAEGARFDLHHDLGVLHLAGDDAEVEDLPAEPVAELGSSTGSGADPGAAKRHNPVEAEAEDPPEEPGAEPVLSASAGGADLCSGAGADPDAAHSHRSMEGRERALEDPPATALGASPRASVRHPALVARDEYKGMRVEVGGGPRRVVTIFVYLNSLPLDVGHTEFPQLGLSVRPQCGCALLFCNVMRDGKPDPRTAHRAAPVTAPHRKFGCNLWLTDVTMQVGGTGRTIPGADSFYRAMSGCNLWPTDVTIHVSGSVGGGQHPLAHKRSTSRARSSCPSPCAPPPVQRRLPPSHPVLSPFTRYRPTLSPPIRLLAPRPATSPPSAPAAACLATCYPPRSIPSTCRHPQRSSD